MKVLYSFFLLLFLVKSTHIRRKQADPQAALLQGPCIGSSCIIGSLTPNHDSLANQSLERLAAKAGYTFVQGLDSPGNTMKTLSDPSQSQATCDSNPQCAGFNTNGQLKSSFLNQSQWISFNANNLLAGTYYKTQVTALDGYIFVQGVDSPGNTIQTPSDSFLWKSTCEKNNTCFGFNTNGALKNYFLPLSQFTPFDPNNKRAGTYFKTSYSPPQPSPLDGYTFVQGLDSPGNTIQTLSDPSTFKATCDADRKCAGFNTGGALKYSFLPQQSQWTPFHATDFFSGTWKKINWSPPQPEAFAGYTFYQGKNSPGYFGTTFDKNNLAAGQAACDQDPACRGFNTNGWTNNGVLSQSHWVSNNPSDFTSGLYVRDNPPSIPPTFNGFIFIPNLDSPGNDILTTYGNIYDMKNACDATSCVAFNTGGELKKSVQLPENWVSYNPNDNLAGTYVQSTIKIITTCPLPYPVCLGACVNGQTTCYSKATYPASKEVCNCTSY